MARRIDALYCTQGVAAQRISALEAEIRKRQQAAAQEVQKAIAERQQALEARGQELMAQIEELAQFKLSELNAQRAQIDAGQCPPATDEDGEPVYSGDQPLYFLNSDGVINFKVGDEDFAEKIGNFGNIGESSTYASNSYATGPALGVLKENRPSFFLVIACDRLGNRRTEGGDEIKVQLEPAECFQDMKVDDLKDGQYKVSFVPLKEGEYELGVFVEEEPIKGAPFKLVVRAPTDYTKIGVDGTDKGQIGVMGEACTANEPGKFHHPAGVCFNSTGDLIFAVDQSNHRIQVVEASSKEVICEFGSKGRGRRHFNSPSHIYMDRENRIYISDLLNHRVQVYQYNNKTRSARYVRTIGEKGSSEGAFLFPKGVVMAEEKGHVLVCDSGNHRVQVFDVNNNFAFLKEFGRKGTTEGCFLTPLDAAIDCEGNILISDKSHRIQIFDEHGTFLTQFGGKGSRMGYMNYPTSIFVNDENALYVCDQANHRIQVFDVKECSYVHKWGGGKVAAQPAEGEGGEGEEPVAEMWVGLRAPAGVAVNPEGMVVVTDYIANTIFVY